MAQSSVNRVDGTGLLMVSVDIDPDHEDEVNRWYWQEHFPERMACPGFQWGARFRAVEGEPRYLALYLLDSPDVLQSEAYAQINRQTPWTQEILPHLRNTTRNVYEIIQPPLIDDAEGATS